MKTPVLLTLPTAALHALAVACRRGLFDNGINHGTVKQAVGNDASELGNELGLLLSAGFNPATLAILIESIENCRAETSNSMDLFDLVLSGPDIPGVPVSDTGAVLHSLIESACDRVELV